ncbi:MAG: ATP-binding protein [Spirochaetes bacterium]|nr:ATP-binding protein [Spirochaetota bacterium]
MGQELKFKISSGLKNIIGKELITNDLIAIFELVKNSYDANAKNVRIVFKNTKDENKNRGAKIYIIDDGDGMSFSDLNEKWLFVGYSEKKNPEKESDIVDYRDKIEKKRVFAGAKGVGRFSCDRLGSKLKLFTKKVNEKQIHHLHMDWNKFEEDQNKEFQTVKVDYSTVSLKDIDEFNIGEFEKGTILEISSFNSDWDWKKLVQLKKYLQRLINPSQVDEKLEFNIHLEAKEYEMEDKKYCSEDEEFKVINGIIKNVIFEKMGIKTTQINCNINETGTKIYTELIDKDTFIFSLEEINEFKYLHNINIKLFFLNPVAKTEFKKNMGLRSIWYGSIFLYKNGFRIHPYGDEGDDWLGLESRKTQGFARYLSNRELMGRIEINDEQSNFKEVSSRDGGIIKTPAYYQLIELFIKKCLKRLEKYVVEGLDWDNIEVRPKNLEDIKTDSLEIIKQIAGQVKDPDKELKFNENLLEIVKEKQVEKLPEIIKNVESLQKSVKDPEEKEYIETQIKAFKQATKTLIKSKKDKDEEVKGLEKEVKQAEKEILFLSSITGEDQKEILGLQHHIGIATSTINNHLVYMKNRMEKGKPIPNDDLVDIISKISLQTQKISSIVKFVTKANYNLKTEKIEKDLVSFIKQYVENVYTQYKEVALDNKNVNINVNLEKEFEFICEFKPLEIIIIIDNLINNSIKANASNIELKIVKLNENGVELRFKDDGKGIKQEITDRIFNFGFTTTGGSGIGLYHVSQIVKKMKGTIDINSSVENGSEFIIKVGKWI